VPVVRAIASRPCHRLFAVALTDFNYLYLLATVSPPSIELVINPASSQWVA
jgi:hypothetical protein